MYPASAQEDMRGIGDRMLAAEDLLDGLAMDLDIDLSSMKAAIESASLQFEYLIVECEYPGGDSEDFYIGRMASIDDDMLQFDRFDALGQWEETSASIPISSITLVQFNTPYILKFSKYLKGVPPRKNETPRP